MSDINTNSHQTTQQNDAVLEEKIQQYLKQLDEQQQLVLKIAMEHLESSFDISKSVGFVEWNK